MSMLLTSKCPLSQVKWKAHEQQALTHETTVGRLTKSRRFFFSFCIVWDNVILTLHCQWIKYHRQNKRFQHAQKISISKWNIRFDWIAYRFLCLFSTFQIQRKVTRCVNFRLMKTNRFNRIIENHFKIDFNCLCFNARDGKNDCMQAPIECLRQFDWQS